ncbi:MAG: hypothetical protein P9L94_13110 [Candidatus Hinthialibacter antarcticus]|nr:hypothetical protein [Candidatus Hinthialibacter antarcticus]
MKETIHPTDQRWNDAAHLRYKDAYPELVKLFRSSLGRSFLRCHWIPDPLALDYLTKVFIRFLPMQTGGASIENILADWEANIDADNPREMIRFYETVGELILWWSGLYKMPVFQDEGKRSYAIAYEQLTEYETPSNRVILMPGQEADYASRRLKVNKMFSEQFIEYQEVLENAELLDNPEHQHFRELFMTDDFSIN